MVWQSSAALHQLLTNCTNILPTPKGTYFLFLHPTKIKPSDLFYEHIPKNTINLPAPLFNAVGAVLLVRFLIKIFALFDILLDTNIFHIFDILSFLIYSFVFIIVLIGGYLAIIQNLLETDQSPKKETEPRQDTAAFFMHWRGWEGVRCIYCLN